MGKEAEESCLKSSRGSLATRVGDAMRVLLVVFTFLRMLGKER